MKKKSGKKSALEKKILAIFMNAPDAKLTIKSVLKKIDQPDLRERQALKAAERLWERALLNKDRGKYSLNLDKVGRPGEVKKKSPKAAGDKASTGKTYKKGSQGKGLDFIIGTVDLTRSGSAFIVSDDVERDVFIPAPRIGTALHGDKVKVKIKDARKNRLEGEIVDVVERRQDQFVGILKLNEENKFAFLIPDDPNMRVDLFVPMSKVNGAKDGQKVVVKVKEWHKDRKKKPVAEVTDILGNPGNNDVEMLSILVESNFPLSFPDEVMREVNNMPTIISEEVIAARRDIRDWPTFTIDPHDAKDFDDALSFRKMENGHYEVGVHIADVTHYVEPGSAMDKEAAKRATSVYLVDRVNPMFPEKLSNIVCSLRPHEDKLCFSAIFELDDKAEIHNEWFGRTVIHSDHRFTYADAQEVLDTAEGPLSDEMWKLNQLAQELRERRFKQGSINFGSEEVRFVLDDEGKPVDVYVKRILDSNLLIEDFMLLANRRVANYVNVKQERARNIPFVNRVHDSPNVEKLMEFARFAATFGYEMKIDTPEQISSSLNKVMEEIQGKPEQHVLEQLAIRCMAKAVYSTKNDGHYGLGFKEYAHFTSPIRRYPDVMVHRILAKVLDPKAKLDFSVGPLQSQCEHCSNMERNALTAERKSTKYKQVEYMSERIGEVFTGVISGVVNFGFFVEIDGNKCEGLVHTDALNDDNYYFDDVRFQHVGHNSGRKFQLGSPVRVRVKKADMESRKIDLELADEPT